MMMPLENRREAIMHLALTAEQHSYEAIFLPETWAYDTTVLLGEIAARTKNIQLGTGILSVWGRSAGTIAMAASTLHSISGGRFILGLGSSTKQLAEGLHDVPYRKPYEKLRQIITQVKALIAGERIAQFSEVDSRPLRLNFPEYAKLPILLAASSPKSIKIAGELCDGWIPFLFPRDNIKDGIALLQEGAELGGRTERDFEVYPIIPTIVAEDSQTARQGAAWVVNFYMKMMGPIYKNALARYGYGDEVDCILEANKNKGTSDVPPEAEALLEQLTLYGTPNEVKDKLSVWYESGATMPCLMVNPKLELEEIGYTLKSIRSRGG